MSNKWKIIIGVVAVVVGLSLAGFTFYIAMTSRSSGTVSVAAVDAPSATETVVVVGEQKFLVSIKPIPILKPKPAPGQVIKFEFTLPPGTSITTSPK